MYKTPVVLITRDALLCTAKSLKQKQICSFATSVPQEISAVRHFTARLDHVTCLSSHLSEGFGQSTSNSRHTNTHPGLLLSLSHPPPACILLPGLEDVCALLKWLQPGTCNEEPRAVVSKHHCRAQSETIITRHILTRQHTIREWHKVNLSSHITI